MAEPDKPDQQSTRRLQRSAYSGSLVSFSHNEKKRALDKLRSVYGVDLRKDCGSDVIALEVAKVLRVALPSSVSEASVMVAAFVRERSEVGAEVLARLASRHPWAPLKISPEMERALARAAEFRALGRESDGGSTRVVYQFEV